MRCGTKVLGTNHVTGEQVRFDTIKDASEFAKMKYITGFAKIFKNYSYSKAIDSIVDVHKMARQKGVEDEH